MQIRETKCLLKYKIMHCSKYQNNNIINSHNISECECADAFDEIHCTLNFDIKSK